jgi:nucleoside-diphosphate-sugar epimerase
MLQEETRSGGLITTSLHPGHIVGPGWHPIGPLGTIDPGVWQKLSTGQPIDVPGIGAEFMHHVHADDVAQAFEAAVAHRDAASGEDFNIVAPSALNVRGYAQIAAAWFGQTAVLRSVAWEEFRHSTTEETFQSTAQPPSTWSMPTSTDPAARPSRGNYRTRPRPTRAR